MVMRRPAESKVTPLSSRDLIPPARQIYQLINTYSFHIAKATEVSQTVPPFDLGNLSCLVAGITVS